MKKAVYILGFSILIFIGIFPQEISANEGRITLQNGPVVCEGISIWQDDRYHVVGRCNGLVYPYQEKLDHYTLWIQPDGTGKRPVKLDDIERGSFEGKFRDPFSGMFITADENGGDREPSNVVIAASTVQRLNFSPPPITPVVTSAVVSPTQTPAPNPTSRPRQAFNVNTLISGRPVIFLIAAVVIVIIILAVVWR